MRPALLIAFLAATPGPPQNFAGLQVTVSGRILKGAMGGNPVFELDGCAGLAVCPEKGISLVAEIVRKADLPIVGAALRPATSDTVLLVFRSVRYPGADDPTVDASAFISDRPCLFRLLAFAGPQKNEAKARAALMEALEPVSFEPKAGPLPPCKQLHALVMGSDRGAEQRGDSDSDPVR